MVIGPGGGGGGSSPTTNGTARVLGGMLIGTVVAGVAATPASGGMGNVSTLAPWGGVPSTGTAWQGSG